MTLPSPPPPVFTGPPSKSYSAISRPHPALNWNNAINFFIFMVSTLCSYCFSTGQGRLMALCPNDMTPCIMAILSTWRRLHLGAIFTYTKHLLELQRQKNVVRMKKDCSVIAWGRGVRQMHHIGRCLHGGGKDDENQCNALMGHHELILVLALKSANFSTSFVGDW